MRGRFVLLGFLLASQLFGTLPASAAGGDGERIEQVLSGVFRQHNAIMLLIEPDSGRIIDANTAASRFYGHPIATLQQLTIQDINALNAEEIARERKLAQSESRNYFIFPHRLADGSVRTVEVYSAPVSIRPDRQLLLSIIHDVSGKYLPEAELMKYQERLQDLVEERTRQLTRQHEREKLLFTGAVIAQFALIAALVYTMRRRRQAERSLLQGQAELQDSEAYNRVLFSDSQLALVVIDPDSGSFIDCNDAAVNIYGAASRAAVLGLTPADVSAPLQADGTPSAVAAQAHIRHALSEGLDVFQWRHRRFNGETWDAEVHLMKFQHHGKTLLQFSLTDITERLRNERQLAEYRDNLESMVDARTRELANALAAADAANRAKTSFLANMSHEIRTPLNGVIGMTYLLQRDDPTPRQQERLQMIANSTRHLLGILNDVLDISRIEANKVVLEETLIDPARLVDEVVSMLGEKAREKQLRLVIDMRGAPERAIGDGMRLKQALVNYLGNAIKFTERGEIRIRCRTLLDSEAGLLVRFEVEDTGIGIAPEALTRLFSPFEQADNSTTRRFGGTGLGLAITRRLAHLMNGDSGAESTPGQGSTFWFTALLHRAPAAGDAMPTMPPPLAPATRDKRLLLVEDEAINREVAVDMLSDLGLRIDIAGDGEEAVLLAQQNRYDLILMDVRMPGMDGLEATRCIRRQEDGWRVPILALTANTFTADREACLAAGMNAFVGKPFEPDHLLATVRQWLTADEPGVGDASAVRH